MYNLMIIEQNTFKLTEIINSIGARFQNIRICHISDDIKNTFEILEKYTIDIILLDLKEDEIVNIIEYLQAHNLYQYRKSIIIKLDKCNNLYKFEKNKYVFSYIKKSDTILKELDRLIKNNEFKLEKIKNKIKQELVNLEYDYSYNGTKYLEETILEVYKAQIDFDGNLSKNIYPIIAKRHQKKSDTIYGNIKQATNLMISKCDRKKLIEYFGYSYYIKPKIQEIIFTILNKIY